MTALFFYTQFMFVWDLLLALLTIIAIPAIYVLGWLIHSKYEDKTLKLNIPLMIILLVALLIFLGLRFAQVL
jgi:asparagine N-glycosylation enzyme membrane subunit Stt3